MIHYQLKINKKMQSLRDYNVEHKIAAVASINNAYHGLREGGETLLLERLSRL